MKTALFIVLAILAAGALWYWLKREQSAPSTFGLVGGTRIELEIADTTAKQVRGLSGRAELCPDCGMLFVYQNPRFQHVWMKDMRFPLDIIFIREGRVTEIYANVPHPAAGQEIARIQSREPADMFLEVNAGFAEKHGIRVGDELSFP